MILNHQRKSLGSWIKTNIVFILIPAFLLSFNRFFYVIARLIVHTTYSSNIIPQDVTNPNSHVWTFPGENWPFVPFFVIPYILSYLYWIVVPFFIYRYVGKKIFFEMCAFVLLSEIISAVWLIIFPTFLNQNYYTDTIKYCDNNKNFFTSLLKNLIFKGDQPDNLSPSFHVLASFIPFVICCQKNHETKKRNYWMFSITFFFFILISLSTLFVHQHYLLDIFVAIALVLVSYLIVKIWSKPSLIIERFTNFIYLGSQWLRCHNFLSSKGKTHYYSKNKFLSLLIVSLITLLFFILLGFVVYFGLATLLLGDPFKKFWSWKVEWAI